VTILEAIRIPLAYACAHNIKLYQMDVKSALLNGKISELVYVVQPLGFEEPKKPNHVYKLSKAHYRLKQAPRAWYNRLRDSCFPNTSKLGRLTLHCSLEELIKTYLFDKFMLMTLFLGLLMSCFTRNLAK
jgi:hypothetical protein